MCIPKVKKNLIWGHKKLPLEEFFKNNWTVKCLRNEEQQYKTKTVWGNEQVRNISFIMFYQPHNYFMVHRKSELHQSCHKKMSPCNWAEEFRADTCQR